MMIRSAPPSTSAPRLLGEDLDQRAEGDLAEGRVVGGRQEAGRPDRAGDERAPARRPCARSRAALRLISSVCSSEAPLVELQPRALEGVGLDHLRARLEHRRVHALDHVGAVEDERLVALAREPAVVLAVSSNCSRVAPMPPSKTTTRSRVAARKSLSVGGQSVLTSIDPGCRTLPCSGEFGGCGGFAGPGPSAALDGRARIAAISPPLSGSRSSPRRRAAGAPARPRARAGACPAR